MTAIHEQLWRLGAAEIAASVGSRDVRVADVIEAHLERITEIDDLIGAVVLVLADDAREAAREADQAVASGSALGRLHGVPFTVKENIDLAGSPTTQGVAALSNAIPLEDAPHVGRLRRAGAIPLARTNCPDLGIGWHTVSSLYGPTFNPWNLDVTPGGSSGGEAAAIATGMSPLGIGGDLSGSLRWPAACCGIAALKPTLGRIPRAPMQEPGDLPLSLQLMLAEGPLARTVADLHLAYTVMAGEDWRDPWTVPAPLDGPPVPSPPRAAVVPNPAPHDTAAEIQAGVRAAGAALSAADYIVEEEDPPEVDRAAAVWLDILTSDMSTAMQTMTPPWGQPQATFVDQLFAMAEPPTAARTLAAYISRLQLLRAWGEFLRGGRVIVAPVYGALPFRADGSLADVAGTFAKMSITTACNVLGLPSVTVPVGIAHGLPIGVQVIGSRFREDLCLMAATVIEASYPPLTPIDPALPNPSGERAPR
ncbi:MULTISPECIES: amidase [Microbacterium]|uniref:amidase n=1 Tax=Microbacterium TaxID=33882 RepID=UPI00146DB2CC|nr:MULTISPECIES: amidase [Microbacterium]